MEDEGKDGVVDHVFISAARLAPDDGVADVAAAGNKAHVQGGVLPPFPDGFQIARNRAGTTA